MKLAVLVRGALSFAALFAVVPWCLPRASGQAPPNPLIEQVRAAWGKRQDAVRTLRVSWTSKTTTPKGALSGLVPQLSDAKRESICPPQDSVHDGTGEILLDGKKTRIVEELMSWDFDKNEFRRMRLESTFDGKLFTQFHRLDPGWPEATIRRDTRNWDGNDMMIAPILVSVRGLDRDLVSKETVLDVTLHARQMQVGGRPLIELTRPRNETRGEGKLWIDSAQGYTLVRDEQYDRHGHLTRRTIVASAVSTPEVGWLPERWTSSMYRGPGKLLKQVEVTTRTRAVNVETTEADFRLRLPPGTRVRDTTESETRDYITREEGGNREILPSELHATYAELAETNTGDLAHEASNPPPKRWRWEFIIAGILIGIVSVWLLLRHRRSGQASDSVPGLPPSP